MARRAVRRAAPGLDRVGRDVVARVELERFGHALVARDALGAIVAGAARRADLGRLRAVIAREARAVRVAEPGVARDQRALRQLGLEQTAELAQVAVGAAPLLGAALVARQARRHRRELARRRE